METCLFCDIARGDIPTKFVYSDPDVVVFRDIQPQAPVHLLVVPRKHLENYSSANEEDELLLGKLARAAAHSAELEGVARTGYRVVVNNGEDAQQSVQHVHLHVLGGRALGWPPG